MCVRILYPFAPAAQSDAGLIAVALLQAVDDVFRE